MSLAWYSCRFIVSRPACEGRVFSRKAPRVASTPKNARVPHRPSRTGICIDRPCRPSVASAAPAPRDLAWRVIGLVNLYRLLVPPMLLGHFLGRGAAVRAAAAASDAVSFRLHRLFLGGRAAGRGAPAVVARAAAHRAAERGHRLRRRSRSSCMPAAASPAASASCSCFRSAPWRCSQTTATRS